jgi:RNA polymerase sigma-70 factor, ECF subfamily
MDIYSDEELMPLVRGFDRDALAAVFDRYNEAIYFYALRLLGSTNLAEECAAETFHRLLRACRHGGGPNDNLKGYLYRTAHNWITDQFRGVSPLPLNEEVELVDDCDTPGQEAEKNINQERIRAALCLLTPEQRQVIVLRFVEGWNLEEVAASMKKTTGSVKALQHRAVVALQKILLSEGKENVTTTRS